MAPQDGRTGFLPPQGGEGRGYHPGLSFSGGASARDLLAGRIIFREHNRRSACAVQRTEQ